MIDPFTAINSPVRLLREQWASPVSLAQELYAMFTAKGPTEIRDTLTIRVGAGKPALRIVQDDGDTVINEGDQHSFGVSKDGTPTSTATPGTKPRPKPADVFSAFRKATSPEARRPTRAKPEPSGTDQPRTRPAMPPPPRTSATPESPSAPPDVLKEVTDAGFATPAQSQALVASSAFASPAISFDAPTRFSGTTVIDRPVFTSDPVFVNATTGHVRTLDDVIAQKKGPRGFPPLAGTALNSTGGSTAALFGAVTTGVGNAWTVQLFTDPVARTLGAVVQVFVPNIGITEVAPIGAVVGPIFKVGSIYAYQPPVWLE